MTAEVDIDPATLQLALNRLAKKTSLDLPLLRPLTLYTMGGAMITTILGTRATTHDIDISLVMVSEEYGHIYPDIVHTIKQCAEEVYDDLLEDGIDLGHGAWLNNALDMCLIDGISPVSVCPLQVDSTYKAFADVDNLIIFQSQELVVKSFSLVHTLVQKLGRIDKDDLDDIQAILSFIESQEKVKFRSSDDVLKLLSERLPNYKNVIENDTGLFRKKLSKIYKR
jgi:hypothetical protein